MANILVVQDVEENILEMKLSLEQSGHNLFVSHSVDSAITLLNATSFDLLICAVYLKSSNVFDLLKFVKSDPERRHLTFVFFCCSPKDIAEYASRTIRNTAIILGANKYITHAEFDAIRFRTEIESLLPDAKQTISNKL
ncbi:MAG: hypothetical protein IAF58_11650 [Leptolyngbya sp.]|nr:hypothetical protein [Candidatus Melainabacteria bacterium]